MTRFLYFLGALFLLTACGDSHRTEIKKAVKRQLEDYPASTLADLYKSFFQDNFGPGHIVNDTAAARQYILYELENANGYDRHYFEPAGKGENYYRVSLATIADSIVPLETYLSIFLESVKDVPQVEIETWRGEWGTIMEVIADMNLNLPDFDTDRAAIDSLLNTGQYAFHHSRTYNRLYKPHYRLISKRLFLDSIKPLIDSTRVY